MPTVDHLPCHVLDPLRPELARAAGARAAPGETWLPAALERCTRAREDGRAYLYFEEFEPEEFERNLMLESPREGTLVLDVLRGGRVGGVELLRRL